MLRWTLTLPLLIISIVLLVMAPLSVFLPTWANQPGAPAALAFPMHPAVADAWSMTDGQIVNGAAERSWLWGPSATSMTLEYYADAPHGVRQMVYFDKGRLDVFDPMAAPDSPWFTVGGLLVSEMISGHVQFGSQALVQRGAAQIPVAGDLDQPDPVTYASFAALYDAQAALTLRGENALLARASAPTAPARVGYPIGSVLLPNGAVVPNGEADAEVLIGSYSDATGHNIAAPFAAWEAAQPFPATWLLGHPISEPYWIDTVVLGTPKRILVQAFERRTLTYTPDNPAAWQVESTNAGSHYRLWRGLSQPADVTLTGLASLEPSGEEIVAAATANGVDPYLLAAIARVTSGGNPLAVSSTGGFGLLGVQPLQGGAPRDDPFANAAAAAQALASFGAGDARAQLALYFQPDNPDLGDPGLAQLVDTTLATVERLRDTYAPSVEEESAAVEPFKATGAANRWSSTFGVGWWEKSLNWHGTWGGAVAGWQLDPGGYYCAHPEYAPGQRLRLIANGVTLDCTVGALVPSAAQDGWSNNWVIELNDAAFNALHLDTANTVTVADVTSVDDLRKINHVTTPGVFISSGMAAYYSPTYDRAWWEWAMSYYNNKGVITPGWSLDPNGLYCVHPNYLPGDRLRLVANGVTIDCTIGDMVADQDVYNWRQRFAVEMGWDTFTALGLQDRNWVDVYYLGPAPKPERLGEPPAETPEPPKQQPPADPTPEPTQPAPPAETPTPDPTTEPTEVVPTEPTAEPTEEAPAEPTAVPTEEAPAEPAVDPTEEIPAEPAGEPTEEAPAEPTEEAPPSG